MPVCDYAMDVASQPLDPSTHLALMQMQYNNQILESQFAKAGGLDYFSGQGVDESWKNNLSTAQSVRLRFKNYQNPFNIVSVTSVEYEEDQSCPPVMADQCDPGCISTENSWRYADIRFKNKFRVGVSWCVESEKLLYQDAESRFQESIDASKTVISTVGWSEVICQSIAAPATTKLPDFQTVFPTHYFDAAAGDPYDVLTLVINYMQRLYGARWQNEFAILADPNFEVQILSRDSNLHAWNENGVQTTNGNVASFVAGGWRAMTAIPRIWGKPVMIAPDSVDFYPTDGALAGQVLNPFKSSSNNKYYVVIASKRSFYSGTISFMDKHYFPATCNNKYDSIQQTWMDFYKVLWPEEIFVVAFDKAGVISL